MRITSKPVILIALCACLSMPAFAVTPNVNIHDGISSNEFVDILVDHYDLDIMSKSGWVELIGLLGEAT